MRTALAIGTLASALLFALGVSLVGCKNTGKALEGSTYCDTTAGSTIQPQSKVPTGACKGSSTCILFTAGECADPTVDAGECEWTCTCLDDTWSCTSSCSSTCTEAADGFTPTPDAS